MSELTEALRLFGFLSIDEISANSLKHAFKASILKAHPDKGGESELFDKILSGYVYLSETFQRIYGGRETLQNIVSPDELRTMRPDELINRIFEEFDNEAFNAEFNKVHPRFDRGYGSWLKNTENETNIVNDGVYGVATQKPPTFEEKDLNTVFEKVIKEGKPIVPSAIILHPEEMAYVSGSVLGTAIIDNNDESFTSNIFTNPEYTDIYSAFNNDNTICDKVAPFSDSTKTFEEILAERNAEIKPFDNDELEEIQAFEKKKIENNTNNLKKIKDYFQNNNTYNSQLESWPPEKYIDESQDNGFLHKF